MPKHEALHFGSYEDYRKWEAFGHIHGVFKERTHPTVYIRGKLHRVKHN